MSRHSIARALPLSLLGLLLVACAAPPAAEVAGEPSTAPVQRNASAPNLLFVMADDHAFQAIGAYGSELVDTPNIDRLAAEGLRFDRAFVGNSLCSPSRATLFTTHSRRILQA